MLLLDEPTNHLDAESVGWLERFLEGFTGTVVAITHDRYFLDNAAGWILELDRGRGFPYEGNYSTWLEAKDQRLAQEQRQEASRQKAIRAELDWVRSNPKGRQAKNKARLARFDELSSQKVFRLLVESFSRIGLGFLLALHLCKVAFLAATGKALSDPL